MTQEQEIDLLRSQAEAIKRELDQVEARMHNLEAGK
jgi:prefoldin subunit 5